jgi:hypothetical protein
LRANYKMFWIFFYYSAVMNSVSIYSPIMSSKSSKSDRPVCSPPIR